MIDFKGVMTGWAELSIKFDIPITTLFNRYHRGIRDDALVEKNHLGKLNKNSADKLTKENVIDIKILLLTSSLTQREIGLKFNIDQSHISDIKRGKRWSEVKVNAEHVLLIKK